MKKIITLLCFFASMQIAFAQSPGLDTTLQKIAAEKDDQKRFELIMGVYSETNNNNPELTLLNLQAVLTQSQKSNDKFAEGLAMANIGACYRLMGNTIKGLELCFKAKTIAEQTGNLYLSRRVKHVLGLIYKDRDDHTMALSQFLAALEDDKIINDVTSRFSTVISFMNIGEMYLKVNKLDSALMYAQRAYEGAERKLENNNLGFILTLLGAIHGKMGNHSLAISYFNMAIEHTKKGRISSNRYLSVAYHEVSQYYKDINKIDSAILYAKKRPCSFAKYLFLYL